MKKSTKLPFTGLTVPETVKTSISGPTVLMKYAEQEIVAGGWNSLSQYLWDFVRRRREIDLYGILRGTNLQPGQEVVALATMAAEETKPFHGAVSPKARGRGQRRRSE